MAIKHDHNFFPNIISSVWQIKPSFSSLFPSEGTPQKQKKINLHDLRISPISTLALIQGVGSEGRGDVNNHEYFPVFIIYFSLAFLPPTSPVCKKFQKSGPKPRLYPKLLLHGKVVVDWTMNNARSLLVPFASCNEKLYHCSSYVHHFTYYALFFFVLFFTNYISYIYIFIYIYIYIPMYWATYTIYYKHSLTILTAR